MADTRPHGTHESPLSRWLGRRNPAILAATCLLALASCASGTAPLISGGHNISPTASASPGASAPSGILPHFSDWRAAYLAPDGRAHVVTLDGKSDLTGPLLPDLTSFGMNAANAGVGPDGKTLAYAAPTLDVVDLTGQTSAYSPQVQGAFNDIMWSPDQNKLYSYSGGGQYSYLTLSTGQMTNVTPDQGIAGEVGWIDNTHLAAISYQGAGYVTDADGNKIPTSATLESLALTGAQARAITTIYAGKPTAFQFALSPDGSQAFYYDAQFRDMAFTPQVSLISMATGRVTPLPTITRATGADFSRIAWRPGSDTIAVSSSIATTGAIKTWLLDVSADTATAITPTGFPVGWAPNNGPLVLSSGWQSGIGQGPFTLTAVTCDSGAQCSGATLTEHATTFTFLGFVRNP